MTANPAWLPHSLTHFLSLHLFYDSGMATEMKIERKSSIEMEPRTLFFDQIQYAREAALYVLSTKTMEEALRIFTEGLQPVLKIRQNEMDMDDIDLSDLNGENNSFLLLDEFQDISSAPF